MVGGVGGPRSPSLSSGVQVVAEPCIAGIASQRSRQTASPLTLEQTPTPKVGGSDVCDVPRLEVFDVEGRVHGEHTGETARIEKGVRAASAAAPPPAGGAPSRQRRGFVAVGHGGLQTVGGSRERKLLGGAPQVPPEVGDQGQPHGDRSSVVEGDHRPCGTVGVQPFGDHLLAGPSLTRRLRRLPLRLELGDDRGDAPKPSADGLGRRPLEWIERSAADCALATCRRGDVRYCPIRSSWNSLQSSS